MSGIDEENAAVAAICRGAPKISQEAAASGASFTATRLWEEIRGMIYGGLTATGDRLGAIDARLEAIERRLSAMEAGMRPNSGQVNAWNFGGAHGQHTCEPWPGPNSGFQSCRHCGRQLTGATG